MIEEADWDCAVVVNILNTHILTHM